MDNTDGAGTTAANAGDFKAETDTEGFVETVLEEEESAALFLRLLLLVAVFPERRLRGETSSGVQVTASQRSEMRYWTKTVRRMTSMTSVRAVLKTEVRTGSSSLS